VPLLGVKPVRAPSRGWPNHQFTGGYDFLGVALQIITCPPPSAEGDLDAAASKE